MVVLAKFAKLEQGLTEEFTFLGSFAHRSSSVDSPENGHAHKFKVHAHVTLRTPLTSTGLDVTASHNRLAASQTLQVEVLELEILASPPGQRE